MKLNKSLVILLIIALNIVAVFVAVPAAFSGNSQYEDTLATARAFYKEDLCEKALLMYDEAASIQDSLELKIEMAEVYCRALENGECSSYYDFSDFLLEMVDTYYDEPKAYETAIEYLYEAEDYENCITVIYQAEDRGIEEKSVLKVRDKLKYLYETGFSVYEDVVYTPENTYLVKSEMYYFLNEGLGSVMGVKFNYATPMLEGFALVKTDKATFLISESDIRESYFPEELTDSTGVGNSLIACQVDGTYSYYGLDGEKAFGKYEFAGRFSNGVAAVKDSKGWYIIDTTGEKVSDKAFEDVKLSQTYDCSSSGIIIAKKDGKYNLYNLEMEKISKKEFDDADVFMDKNSLAACKIGDKWGFVNASGEVVIKAQYEDARSFSNGLAGVKTGEYWSFINENNDVAIQGEFEDVNYFNSNGYCFVKEDTYWSYILRAYLERY